MRLRLRRLSRQSTVQPVVELTVPEPPYPQFPEKCGDIEPDPKYLPQDGNPCRTGVTVPMVSRALKGWLVPYLLTPAPGRLSPGHRLPVHRIQAIWRAVTAGPLTTT